MLNIVNCIYITYCVIYSAYPHYYYNYRGKHKNESHHNYPIAFISPQIHPQNNNSIKVMKVLSAKQVLIRISTIIISIELMIMLTFGMFPLSLNTYQIAFLDITVLAIISTPLIYLLAVKPFINAKDGVLAKLNDLANLDPLTKLANRRLLYTYLDKIIVGNIKQRSYGILMLLDLDGFKIVNDTHGHHAGDTVLIEIGKRLQSATREGDIVSRIGGDEIVVLIHHLDSNEQATREKALQIANKLTNLIKKPIDWNNVSLEVGVSIGIRVLGSDSKDVDIILQDADSAMYRAKKTRSECVIFSDKLTI